MPSPGCGVMFFALSPRRDARDAPGEKPSIPGEGTLASLLYARYKIGKNCSISYGVTWTR